MLDKPLPPLKEGIEAVQIQHEGKPMVLLHDREGLSKQSLAVTLPGFLIATLLDGRNTITDVQTHFSKATGTLIKAEEIQTMLQQFDKALLLETEILQNKRRQVMQEFLDNPIRHATHVKVGYPENTLELAPFIGKFFQDPKGPQKPTVSTPTQPTPLALFAPHIDLQRGGPAYAWAYQALSACKKPDLIVALGVAHMTPNSPWVLLQPRFISCVST